MVDGGAALMAEDVRLNAIELDGFLFGEEGVHHDLRIHAVVSSDSDFDAVAGGKDHYLGDAVARFQIGQ